MDNEKFRSIWEMLDGRLHSAPAGLRITDLTHSGKIGAARALKEDLDEWCRELAARAKAEFATATQGFESLREEFGAAFDEIEPNHMNGLDFGKPR